MESYKIENLSFTYPNEEKPALHDIGICINEGEFVTVCGKSGCGKTTLLRLLKPILSPVGNLSGNIYFEGQPLKDADARYQASKIGFVMQSPDNQIVTDKVWHELAFGLESLGYKTSQIRARVSEMASFFGIQEWFYKKVTELSGGQKQILNLASVMVMQPSVLILDEPTSQLDPICADEFLRMLEKINREIGTTVILSEHRLEEAFPISDRVIVMDEGRIIADSSPKEVACILKRTNHDMYDALPAPMRIYGSVEDGTEYPISVRDGRCWLEEYADKHDLNAFAIPKCETHEQATQTAVVMKDVWFRYEKNLPDVIKGLNVTINKGELFAVLGGNGTGKTTALSLISGLNTPYRGEIFINGINTKKTNNVHNGDIAVLPQNPQTLFVKKTVYLDLMEMLSDKKMTKEEREERVQNVAALCRIENLLKRHPYDLSGGEQQRAALAKVLLINPRILLLDEPTKGLDAHFKQIFADIIANMKESGITIIMVSHDIEFCAEYADVCALFFDGNITSIGTGREFFSGKSFYTTSSNRMARTRLPEAVLTEDIILACGGRVKDKGHINLTKLMPQNKKNKEEKKKEEKKITPIKIIMGIIFAVLFIITCIFDKKNELADNIWAVQILTVLELMLCFICLIPKKELETGTVQKPKNKRKLSKRTLISAMLILFLIPLTIYIGTFYLGDRKYYFISLLIILETMIPFFMIFEGRKPQARELVVISVMCAVAVAGRAAFYMLPQFKPVAAVVIITGVCLGAEAGFLTGAVTGFVSNFFFGQGPWTPWQMFAFGIIGFLAGVLFEKGFLRKTKSSLCVFGFFSVLIVYGGIMNPASVIMWQDNITKEMILSSFVMGIPFDLVHAISTAFFLWFISEPMIDKLERIKSKYGFLNTN